MFRSRNGEDPSTHHPKNYKNNFKKLFKNLSFFKIDDAGHWLHVERPQEFIKIISKKLI